MTKWCNFSQREGLAVSLSRVCSTLILGLATTVLIGCAAAPTASPPVENSQEGTLEFQQSGSASMNMPIFEDVLAESGAGSRGHSLEDSITALVRAGFPIEAITHTPVNSKTSGPAESVSLAIAIGQQCLIAQFSDSWLQTTVAEPTVSGCLIGDVQAATLD